MAYGAVSSRKNMASRAVISPAHQMDSAYAKTDSRISTLAQVSMLPIPQAAKQENTAPLSSQRLNKLSPGDVWREHPSQRQQQRDHTQRGQQDATPQQAREDAEQPGEQRLSPVKNRADSVPV